MAARIGKCTNYSGCKLAYRNEKISVVTKDFRCPECGSPLESLETAKSSSLIWIVAAGVAVVLILAIGAVIWTLRKPPRRHVVVMATPIPTPLPTPPPTPVPTPSATPMFDWPPKATPTPTPTPAPTPDTSVINLDVKTEEIADVKRQVLERIEKMPDISEQNKRRLYDSVEKAKGMGRLFTVSFETARNVVSPQELVGMKANLARPQIAELLGDPTLVFVILGYADKQGDRQKNLDLSKTRADAVTNALRDQCGVQNLVHSVPMGGSDLLDSSVLAKNRVVEVWAVLP